MAARRNENGHWPTIREAARRAGIGERAIRVAVRLGEIPAYAPPGTWLRVEWRSVERWIRSYRIPPSDHARARVEELLRKERSV